MNEQQPLHILTKLGILTSFSISKKITEKEINSFYNKKVLAGKSEEEVEELLKEKIIKEIQSGLESQKIPGLILPTIPLGKDSEDITLINEFLIYVTHELITKKYNKMTQCYFINAMINILGLTESDFNKFHKKMSSQSEEESSDDND